MRIGWIGLGQIGTPMVLRIRAAGHEVIGHSRRDDGRESLRAAGVTLTRSLVETARGADMLGVAVFDDAQLREVLLGPEGVLAAMQPGAVVFTHTTGSPRLAEEIARRAPPGVEFLDACFSGTAQQASEGRLTLMVGGSNEALERARPVIGTYGGNIVHAGPVGMGQRMKLLNNILFGAHTLLAMEAVNIAERQGLPRHVLVPALMASSGASYALNMFGGAATPAQLFEGLRKYIDKDVEVARESARDAGIDLGRLAAATTEFTLRR